MEIYQLVQNELLRVLPECPAELPAEGIFWLDVERDYSAGWERWPKQWLGVLIDFQHISDCQNPSHTSFFDGTSDYDMLIMEGLGCDHPFPLETRSAAFFLFDRVLITVRAHENRSFGAIKQKLMSGRLRCPPNPRCLAHMLLDGMIDRYLAIREPMDKRLTQLQDQLLSEGQSNPRDWRELLSHRREARRLEALCEDQLEALDGWRRNSRIEWHEHETVRVRDLQEHIQRVLDHASNLEHDIESAVQLHFATVSHRTNEIIQTLTVLSAIFFPLTLLTGIWGMNFENMPELKTKYGYFFALGTLVTVAACLLTLFKKRKFF